MKLIDFLEILEKYFATLIFSYTFALPKNDFGPFHLRQGYGERVVRLGKAFEHKACSPDEASA